MPDLSSFNRRPSSVVLHPSCFIRPPSSVVLLLHELIHPLTPELKRNQALARDAGARIVGLDTQADLAQSSIARSHCALEVQKGSR